MQGNVAGKLLFKFEQIDGESTTKKISPVVTVAF